MSNWKDCPPEDDGIYWLRHKSLRDPFPIEYHKSRPGTDTDPLGRRAYYEFPNEFHSEGSENFNRINATYEYQKVEKWRE